MICRRCSSCRYKLKLWTLPRYHQILTSFEIFSGAELWDWDNKYCLFNPWRALDSNQVSLSHILKMETSLILIFEVEFLTWMNDSLFQTVELRGVAKVGELINFEACMEIMDLLYEKEETTFLYRSPRSLAASILVIY